MARRAKSIIWKKFCHIQSIITFVHLVGASGSPFIALSATPPMKNNVTGSLSRQLFVPFKNDRAKFDSDKAKK